MFGKKIVTLYIDDSNLRLLVTKGRQIKKWAELPLEPGLVKSNVVLDEIEVAAKVKQLLKGQKVRTKRVIVGLSALHSVSRILAFPSLPKAMMPEAVVREAKRVLPVPLEQLYISWQPIPSPEGKTHIFLLAIPCRIADALLKTLRKAGLKPYHLDIKPLALARAVNETDAIVIDVQPTEFDIVLIVNGVPHTFRTVPFPVEPLSSEQKLVMIKDELERTIQFHNSNNPEKPVFPEVPVFVSGELVSEPEGYASLSERLGYRVLPFLSPLKAKERFSPSRYVINIGLAINELGASVETGSAVARLNSLPVPYIPERFSISRVVVLPGTVSVIALLVFLTGMVQNASANIDLMRTQLGTADYLLKQKQQTKKELTENLTQLEKKLAEVGKNRNTFTAALASLKARVGEVNGDFIAATSCLPEGITLTGIEHMSGKLTVKGTSPDETKILAYARALTDTGRFSQTIIASVKMRDKVNSLDFILILRAKGQS